jgi:hypothetical protein
MTREPYQNSYMGMRMTPESQSGLIRVEFVDLRKHIRESNVFAEYDALRKGHND